MKNKYSKEKLARYQNQHLKFKYIHVFHHITASSAKSRPLRIPLLIKFKFLHVSSGWS